MKVNYTTPLFMKFGYSNSTIAFTTLLGVLPLIILMPMFGKIFRKIKYTSIILFCVLVTILQTLLFILFLENLPIILFGSFLTGFIFPLYTPVFGLFLRKSLNHKFISTGFTITFTAQNLFIFIFNQLVVIQVLGVTNTIISAFNIILMFFILSLIPLLILRVKKY